MEKVYLTNEEWEKKLTKEQYRVLRQKGTERAWTGELLDNEEFGLYECAGCGNELFVSDTKFDSSCGWPSFFEPIRKDAVKFHLDKSFGMSRTEVTCAACDGHLGHVFHDGPPPTGDRYCMNSVSLKFKKISED